MTTKKRRTKKTRTRTRTRTRTQTQTQTTPNLNQPLNIVNQGMKATIGLAALGITASTVTKIAKN
jgi:hypothetical protein